MTTLVTGAGGFLGGHICRRLRVSGQAVRGFDLAYPGRRHDDDVVGSILEPETLRPAFEGVTGVIHAAALAQLWVPGRFDYDRVNGVGTCRVLAEARRVGAKLVYVSSYTTLIGRDMIDVGKGAYPALLDYKLQTSADAPEAPRARVWARNASSVRTTAAGSRGPTPQAWLRRRLRWRSSSLSEGTVVPLSAPKPVFTP